MSKCEILCLVILFVLSDLIVAARVQFPEFVPWLVCCSHHEGEESPLLFVVCLLLGVKECRRLLPFPNLLHLQPFCAHVPSQHYCLLQKSATLNSGILSFFFLRFYLFTFREKERQRERERNNNMRETSVSCLLHTTNQGPGPQPRHVPWLGIEPVTFQFTSWHSSHWAIPARASSGILEPLFLPSELFNFTVYTRFPFSVVCVCQASQRQWTAFYDWL